MPATVVPFDTTYVHSARGLWRRTARMGIPADIAAPKSWVQLLLTGLFYAVNKGRAFMFEVSGAFGAPGRVNTPPSM